MKIYKANIRAATFLILLLCHLLAVPASAGAIIYTYDDAGRLTGADYGGGKSIIYAYDANGNLLQRKINSAAVNPVPDIKANGQDGAINVGEGTPVSITVGLNPGNYAGQLADWWIAANTPLATPLDWYTYVHPTGWRAGINLCAQTPLFEFSGFEVLNITLSSGHYTFYFAIDDPDGVATGPWWGLDSVEVTVQ